MRTRSSELFCPAQLRIEDPPSSDALFNAFLSSLWVKEEAACSILYSAAIRHFLHWLDVHAIPVSTLGDQVVRRFEKHRCRCHGYSAQQAAYKTDQAARVRRFVRFLEDQGYIEVDDGIDDLPVTSPTTPMQSTACNSPLEWHRATGRKPSILWLGFASSGSRGPMSMTRSSTSTRRMVAAVRSGASGASSSPRARSGGGVALGTSSSSCAAGVSSLQSNRCRMTTRTWRHIWHGSSNTAARPMRRSGATGPISGGSCLCSATLHNGMQPSSGVRFNNEARRRRVLHHCSSR